MKKKSVRTVLLIALAVIVLSIIVGSIYAYLYNYTLPNAANDVLTKYMDAYKNGTKEAAQFAYFKNDQIKTTYMNAGTILYDYRIEEISRINDDLFALTVLVKTNRTGESYMRVYNFLGRIDNSWRFINGVGNIPDEINQNLDIEAYSYK